MSYKCCECGAPCDGKKRKQTSSLFNPDGNCLCDDCYQTYCANQAKAFAFFGKMIWVPLCACLRWCLKGLVWCCLNKYVVTVCTAGLSWLTWKWLEKVYGDGAVKADGDDDSEEEEDASDDSED